MNELESTTEELSPDVAVASKGGQISHEVMVVICEIRHEAEEALDDGARWRRIGRTLVEDERILSGWTDGLSECR